MVKKEVKRWGNLLESNRTVGRKANKIWGSFEEIQHLMIGVSKIESGGYNGKEINRDIIKHVP